MSVGEVLQQTAIAMIAAVDAGRSVLAVLRARCPFVYRQVRRDALYPGLLALWGRSVNFDDEAPEVIVHPAIARALGEQLGAPVRGRVVHAGLQHTYGYLFSLLKTPYGFKRDRWTSTGLERGLGVDLSLLGARPAAGTLLANATWLMGQIAFRGDRRALARLARQADAVAPALVTYDFSALTVTRIEERARLPGQACCEVALVTDLLTLSRAPKGDRWLVYSVRGGARAPLRLVTAFPVSPAGVESLRASTPPGPAEVRLRYNAYVPGLYRRTVRGHRIVIE